MNAEEAEGAGDARGEQSRYRLGRTLGQVGNTLMPSAGIILHTQNSAFASLTQRVDRMHAG